MAPDSVLDHVVSLVGDVKPVTAALRSKKRKATSEDMCVQGSLSSVLTASSSAASNKIASVLAIDLGDLQSRIVESMPTALPSMQSQLVGLLDIFDADVKPRVKVEDSDGDVKPDLAVEEDVRPDGPSQVKRPRLDVP